MNITKEDLKRILDNHNKWLKGEGGERADLRSADLSSANLSYANLSSADLRYADLRYANLSSANLSYADLRSADLSSANLSYADLSYANLSSANLSYANLSSADLRSANLRSANLDKRYVQIGCIGSRKDITIYCFEDDKIWCGCFTGTLKEFDKKCKKSYPEKTNKFHKEYIGAIKYIKSLK
jgi:hypothetical protein